MDGALASLHAQDMGDDLEIIVQDGDKEPDQGQSDAFNRGFAKARGEWLFWLNSDDMLLPGALKKVGEFISRRSSAGDDALQWIAGDQLKIDADGCVVECSVGNGWHDWLYRHAVPHVYGPSSFFRRELFGRVGGFDESLHICMDWDLWIRFMRAGARFERIRSYVWTLRQWTGSKTQRAMTDEELAEQQKEVSRMLAKNGFTITSSGVWLSRAWRMICGAYVREWRDGCRLRGRKAASCES